MNTEEEFKAELKALLKKHKVEISVEDYRDGNPEINFYRGPVYDKEGDEVFELINWNVRWMNGDEQ